MFHIDTLCPRELAVLWASFGAKIEYCTVHNFSFESKKKIPMNLLLSVDSSESFYIISALLLKALRLLQRQQ